MTWKRSSAKLCEQLAKLPRLELVDALNEVRRQLHEISPFRDQPVDCVEWVKADAVQANDYNPNTVAPPEMKLLETSIVADGYTQPIVTHDDGAVRVVVDGFHRNRVGKECRAVRDRVHGYLPCVKIRAEQTSAEARMASTIRHNRARGRHGVDAMTEIVAYMTKRGWDDAKIAKELGMDSDEVLRFRQVGGLAELFKDQPFSEAWEPVDAPES